MKRLIFTSLCIIFAHFYLLAAEISVTTSTFLASYNAATDGDVLLLSAGTYQFIKP